MRAAPRKLATNMQQQEQQAPLDIFRPSTSSRQVDYATGTKLRFDRQHLEEPR